jgi:hypothetical protein
MAGPASISGDERFADPLTQRIAAFLCGIGVEVRPAALDEATPCPGVFVRRGVLLVDEARLAWPGDLLHEAGHIAVCEPAARHAAEAIGDDPGEEMAAIAWSYAAARALGLDPAVVFHAGGYRGGGQWVVDLFEGGGVLGTPLLEWFGMTLGAKAAAERGVPPFPHMLRWLR